MRVRRKVVSACADAMARILRDTHSVPRNISDVLVRNLADDPTVAPTMDEALLAERLAPHVEVLKRKAAFQQGLATFRAEAAQAKFAFFEEDVGDAAFVGHLVENRMEDAATAMAVLRNARAKRMLVDGMLTTSLERIEAAARSGDSRPGQIVRQAMPVLGATMKTAAKAMARIFGVSGPGADAFAEAVALGEEISRKRAAEERNRHSAWRASLLDAAGARATLGARPAEFTRWMSEGRIPVAETVAFRKWGQSLSTTRHDPQVLSAILAKTGRMASRICGSLGRAPVSNRQSRGPGAQGRSEAAHPCRCA